MPSSAADAAASADASGGRQRKRVAVVGAGACGLTAARQALQYDCNVVVFERAEHIGGVWRLAVDKNAKRRPVPAHSAMHSSAALCAFSELPISGEDLPLPASTFMLPQHAHAYLTRYARTFGLERHIRTRAEVRDIRRADNWRDTGQWILRWKKVNEEEEADEEEEEEVFDAVMLCTGSRLRRWRPPEYRLEKAFKGVVMHSEQFVHPAAHAGQCVCVVGAGNSALEIATALAYTAKLVYLCVRRGEWLLSRFRPPVGQPWDWAYSSRWRAFWRQLAPKWARQAAWERHEAGTMVLNSNNAQGEMPSHGLLSANFTFGAEQFGALQAAGRICLKPDLLSLSDSNKVEFADGTTVEGVDAVILCTGFEFDFRLVERGKLLRVMYNDFHLYKHMYAPELAPHHSLAVIGHVQPRGDCIWPLAELQARLFLHALHGRTRLPTPFWMKAELEKRRCAVSVNMLKTRRHTQTEDFVPFASELASLIGADPPLCARLFLRDPRLALALLFGPCCSAQFRLRGPFAQAESARSAVIKVAEQAGVFSVRKWIDSQGCLILIIALLIVRTFLL